MNFIVVEVKNEEIVKNLKPDLNKIKELGK